MRLRSLYSRHPDGGTAFIYREIDNGDNDAMMLMQINSMFFVTKVEAPVTFRCGKVVFATAAEFKPNHRDQSLTLEGALEHLLRLQCNDHQTENAKFQNKSLLGRFLEKEECS